MNWLKIGNVAWMLTAFVLLLHVYGKAREKAGHATATAEWQAKLADLVRKQAQQSASAQVVMAARQVRAAESYADRVASIEPIIVRSQIRTIEYAKTAEGAGACLPADRVREIAANRASLFAAPAVSASGEPLALLPGSFADAP